jgi:hypothetical protein
MVRTTLPQFLIPRSSFFIFSSAIDEMLGRVIGDRILMNRFPREAST